MVRLPLPGNDGITLDTKRQSAVGTGINDAVLSRKVQIDNRQKTESATGIRKLDTHFCTQSQRYVTTPFFPKYSVMFIIPAAISEIKGLQWDILKKW